MIVLWQIIIYRLIFRQVAWYFFFFRSYFDNFVCKSSLLLGLRFFHSVVTFFCKSVVIFYNWQGSWIKRFSVKFRLNEWSTKATWLLNNVLDCLLFFRSSNPSHTFFYTVYQIVERYNLSLTNRLIGPWNLVN